jgi:hypothetical protein
MNKVVQFIKNTIWAPISELDIFVIFILFVCLLFEFKDRIAIWILFVYSSLFKFDTFSDQAVVFVCLFIVVLFLLLLLYRIIKNALVYELLHYKEREMLSGFFYMSIGLVSTQSILDHRSFSDVFNNLSITTILPAFILARSIISLGALYLFTRTSRENVYATQLTDDQMTKLDVLLSILLGIIIYMWIRRSEMVATTIIVSYFYITMLVLIIHKLASYVKVHFQHC